MRACTCNGIIDYLPFLLGGAVASWLVSSTPDRAVRVRALARGHCVVFLGATHNSHSTSLHPRCIYMLFAGLGSVRIVKNCDRGLENAARGRRPRAAFSNPRSQFFTIRTDPKPVNNSFIFFQALKRKKPHRKKLTQALL